MTWRNTSSSNYFEYILLIAVAGIGLAGSLFVFSECPDAEMNSLKTSAMHSQAYAGESLMQGQSLEQWISISGEPKQQRALHIEWTAPRKDARYVLDMGNGERVMLRGAAFDYTYSESGTYTLTFREIYKSLISTIGTAQIVISEDGILGEAIRY